MHAAKLFAYFACMKHLLVFCLLLVGLYTKAQSISDIIPAPLYANAGKETFWLDKPVSLQADPAFAAAARLLTEEWHLNVVKAGDHRSRRLITLEKTRSSNDTLGKEGYRLDIASNKIRLRASDLPGMLHAIFTLIQLRYIQPDPLIIPGGTIIDRPRFSYRGMHLDVSRNFFPVSFVKKYIDLMALYKCNRFHWHLTDGPGWRLEIKRYPALTRQAAFRTHADWKSWWKSDRHYAHEGDPNAFGGYYTQDEAKEVVAYAAARGITVIPEIEMPGHSEEVLAVYPQLSCSGQPFRSSEFCIGNEESFSFITGVLEEVLQVFPSLYIHAGGDEASTSAWKTCPKCQQKKKELGLTTEHELQAYLMKRVDTWLRAHGRKLLGWDEILEGGLAPGATVMSWRGEKGGLDAARLDHDVVMTPNETYLDAYQTNPAGEPEAIGGYLPITRVYNYEPVPASLEPEKRKFILGTQSCLWTEYIPTTYQAEYMAFPRAIALAETGWSQPEKKDWTDFRRRLQAQYRLLQRKSVNYYRPSARLSVHVEPDSIAQVDKVELLSEQYQPVIFYTIDGTMPTPHSSRYNGPFITKGQTKIVAAIFEDAAIQGEASSFTINYHQAIGKKVVYNTLWSGSYPAQGSATLTNGIEGSLSYSDKQWLGYLNNFDATVDMGTIKEIKEVSIRFMQQPGPGVFLPGSVEIQLSEDGEHFTSMAKEITSIGPEVAGVFKNYLFQFTAAKARYIRVLAPNTRGGFMFTDEIIVY